jgi:hypothetical protein
MAKKSAAGLAVIPANRVREATAAPADLGNAEKTLWVAVVESKPAEWFGPDSYPVLKEYVRAATMCDLLASRIAIALDGDDAGEIKMLLDLRDKESRRSVSLATKLRLTQQSRYGARSADTADRRAGGKRPWQVAG